MGKKVSIYFIVFLLPACHGKEPWELLVEESISRINQEIEVTEINLDQLNGKNVEPDVVITPDTSVIIGTPRDLFILNDSLYLLDQAQNTVFVIDNEGTVTRKIDKTGRGPGEVTRATSMATNGEFIFIYDHGNARLQMLDEDYNDVAYINASPNPFTRSLTTAGSWLYFTDALSQGRGETNLIKQYSIYPELEKQRVLVPRLLPEGVQPRVVNNISFHANVDGYIVAAYDAIPRLFLYNPEGELMQSIRLFGSPVERLNERNNQLKKKYRSDPRGQIGLAPFIHSVLLDDQLNIYLVTVEKQIFIFSLRDNVYQLAGNNIVEHPSGGGSGIRPIIYEDRMFLVYDNYPDILGYNLKGFFHDDSMMNIWGHANNEN